MKKMRDQMKALTQGIATSARERQAVVGDSKVQTTRMLQAFGRERAVMMKALKSALVADRVSRSVNMCAIRADAGTMRQEFRQAQVRRRHSLRHELVQSTEAVATFVACLRADFAKARADFAEAHRAMTKEQRAQLAKDRGDRAREVAELINNFHVSRGEMAQELAASLAKSTQEISSQVSGLKEGFRASLHRTRADAWNPRQIPHSLMATQSGGEERVPFSALIHEPDQRKRKGGYEDKEWVL